MDGSELKDVLRRVFPRWLIVAATLVPNELATLREFLIDGWRYQRSTSYKTAPLSGPRLEARITMTYHQIEKALTFPAPRRPFGLRVAKDLRSLLGRSRSASDNLAPYARYADDALAALDLWNGEGKIDDLVGPVGPERGTPVLPHGELTRYFESRRSVRNFDVDRVPTIEMLDNAVALARHTPSVCNRQAGRIHLYRSRERVRELLRHQNGNRGFGESVSCLAVVTVEREAFLGVGERNQRWVDGGLLAMSFVWALHGLGLSTCMLNWSEANAATDRLRIAGDIPAHEDVIVMIAIGYPAAGHRVARSERRSVEGVRSLHD